MPATLKSFLFLVLSIQLTAKHRAIAPVIQHLQVDWSQFHDSPLKDSVSCSIPFSRAGNLIVIKARADSLEGNFILDTGAPHLILNLTYFRDYPSVTLTDVEHTSITGAGAAVLKTVIKDFRLGTLDYKSLDADLVNLGHLENKKGIKILGLLGVELFADCQLIIDYEKNMIYLHRFANRKPSYDHGIVNGKEPFQTLPIHLMENKVITNIQLGGRQLKFAIDVAAETNLIDSRLPKKIFDNIEITGRVFLHGVSAKKIEALQGSLSNMTIGGLALNTMPVIVTNLENTCFGDPNCIDGVLGFDFLSLQKIGFNFVKRKMYLWR